MLKSRKGLILFAKVPKPGHVKTRLHSHLSPEQANDLYRTFIMDLLSATGHLKGIIRILGCDPNGQDPFFQSLAHRYQLKLINQNGANLGERMQNAMAEAHRQGFNRIVIIGTDCPTLPMEFIRETFTLLRSHELVLGPSRDGGYYLVGCGKRIPPVFEGIPWSTDRVLAMTLRRATDLKLKCALLPFWYDVDDVEDLRLLAAHLDCLEQQTEGGVAPETARMMKTLKW